MVPLALHTPVRFDFLNLTGEPLPALDVCHAPLARSSNRLESSLKFRGREEVVARQDQGGMPLNCPRTPCLG
jgi:hypothetical protein